MTLAASMQAQNLAVSRTIGGPSIIVTPGGSAAAEMRDRGGVWGGNAGYGTGAVNSNLNGSSFIYTSGSPTTGTSSYGWADFFGDWLARIFKNTQVSLQPPTEKVPMRDADGVQQVNR